MESIKELKQDCDELQSLLKIATRSNVRQLIASEITLLESKILKFQHDDKKQDEITNGDSSVSEKVQNEEKTEAAHVFTKKIQSYGWDQTEKAIRIYVSLKGIESVSKENIRLDVKEDSFDLVVFNLDGKNYSLNLNKLLAPINSSGSFFTAKSGNIKITLRKKIAKQWTHLTSLEKGSSDVKPHRKIVVFTTHPDGNRTVKGYRFDVLRRTPSLDKDEDPSSSVMKLMKQMYDDGDDEMKRTIAKAWTESRDKQGSGKLDI